MGLLQRHGLAAASTPTELRQLWTHTSGWWLAPLDTWLDSGGRVTELEAWVEKSQARQAAMIGYAARRSLARFPACAGFLVWLGHDTFPCAVSLSLLDADGDLKPAAEAFRDVFAAPTDPLTTSPQEQR
jgi:beta-mannosidase